ncbi:MAG: hypothetical protein JWM80_3143 [Cyanobacteria bacterium RYN_339]|nr:hypothetical protein [Cyanobacteria bacterium RYN_339]
MRDGGIGVGLGTFTSANITRDGVKWEMPAPEPFSQYLPDRDAAGRPMSIAIRPAGPADAGLLGELVASRDLGNQADHRDRFLAEFEDRARVILVAEVAGQVAGFGRLRHVQQAAPRAPKASPDGWYLAGLIVAPGFRRLGVGHLLTVRRLAQVRPMSPEVYYFANARNLASIDLHTRFGFQEVTRDFVFPGVTFTGGVGILFRLAF